jgi:uncharacterized protein (DUF342 family)
MTNMGIGYEGVFNKIDTAIDETISEKFKMYSDKLSTVKGNMEEAKQTVDMTFPREKELQEKIERLNALTTELKLNDYSDERNAAATISDDENNNIQTSRGRH